MARNLFNIGVKKADLQDKIDKPKTILQENNEMTDSEFDKLRSLIYELSGIYFTDSKKYLLESRIQKRVTANSLQGFSEYIDYISNPQNIQELYSLFDAVTINETYFFRVPHQFEALENIIIPEIIKAKQTTFNPTIRIWSAASSSGEEAYTIAMIINERILQHNPEVNFQIIGTDISASMIEAAKNGVYREYAIRNIPVHYLKKYFTEQNGNYILSDTIKKMVKFTNLNLYNSADIRTLSQIDIVFCANVLIYFDIPSKQKVVSDIHSIMSKDAYLFIGYSESLHGISKAFKLVHLPKVMAYQKD